MGNGAGSPAWVGRAGVAAAGVRPPDDGPRNTHESTAAATSGAALARVSSVHPIDCDTPVMAMCSPPHSPQAIRNLTFRGLSRPFGADTERDEARSRFAAAILPRDQLGVKASRLRARR